MPHLGILLIGQFSIAFWPDHMAKLLVTTQCISKNPNSMQFRGMELVYFYLL